MRATVVSVLISFFLLVSSFAPAAMYTVKSGDTLISVARKTDHTISELRAMNPDITDPNKIYIGQRVVYISFDDLWNASLKLGEDAYWLELGRQRLLSELVRDASQRDAVNAVAIWIDDADKFENTLKLFCDRRICYDLEHHSDCIGFITILKWASEGKKYAERPNLLYCPIRKGGIIGS